MNMWVHCSSVCLMMTPCSPQTRLWRKTRSYHYSPLGCKGVDANRNYGHHWNGQLVGSVGLII